MMLGVRRAGVTVAASGRRRAGFIDYKGGSVTIIDRHGLEQRECECYGSQKGSPIACSAAINCPVREPTG